MRKGKAVGMRIVSVAKLLWFAGVSFALMALWTWYNFVRS